MAELVDDGPLRGQQIVEHFDVLTAAEGSTRNAAFAEADVAEIVGMRELQSEVERLVGGNIGVPPTLVIGRGKRTADRRDDFARATDSAGDLHGGDLDSRNRQAAWIVHDPAQWLAGSELEGELRGGAYRRTSGPQRGRSAARNDEVEGSIPTLGNTERTSRLVIQFQGQLGLGHSRENLGCGKGIARLVEYLNLHGMQSLALRRTTPSRREPPET